MSHQYLMNKKLLWFIGFVVVAAVSCWATASSFHLMMPSMPIIAVWAITIVFFCLASYAVKLIMDAIDPDYFVNNPKAQMWGGIVLLVFTWIIVSLPTNAHTFFYKLKIGDVVTGDLKTTKQYSEQLMNRMVTDSAYFELEKEVLAEYGAFQNEVMGNEKNHDYSGRPGIDQHAIDRIVNVNIALGSGYTVPLPPLMKGSDPRLTDVCNLWKGYVDNSLAKLKQDKYQAPEEAVRTAQKDVQNIIAMEDTVHNLILTSRISKSEAEPLIKECEGVLVVAYSNIKNNKDYVAFDQDTKDESLYTAEVLETKTTRFLNPYSVAADFFSGKIPFAFIFWLILSILIDVSGFIFFYKATKKDMSF